MNFPSWPNQPLLVIPALELRFWPSGWSVRFMFPTSPISIKSFSYVQRNFPSRSALDEFLSDWESSPELAVRKWFDREPPRALRAGEALPTGDEVSANAGDLGL